MTNPFEHIPEVTPQLIIPEIKKEDQQVPIEVIEGALRDLDNEEEVGDDEHIPSIH